MKTTCQVIIAVYVLVQTLWVVGKDIQIKDDDKRAFGLVITAVMMSAMISVLYFSGSFSELIGD